MQKLKIAFLTLLSMFSLTAVPVVVMAQATDSKAAVCEGLALAGGDCGSDKTNSTISNVIKTAIRIFQMIVGIIALFTIITAGLTYITSAGDGSKTATAKNRIMYAAIGLVVVALAEVIVQFILDKVPTK